MKPLTLFITGTDTDVGKTLITGALAKYFISNGEKVITQKWVQTGCLDYSEDILEHIKVSGNSLLVDNGNSDNRAPYILSYPASPHLAAKIDNIIIDRSKILEAYSKLCLYFDKIIIEGSGGVLVPFNDKEYLIDIVKEIDVPVILVSANRLGAINHTLLSIEALKNRGLNVLGIIFNNLSPVNDRVISEDNCEIINKISGVPILGEVPYMENIEKLEPLIREIGLKIEKQVL